MTHMKKKFSGLFVKYDLSLLIINDFRNDCFTLLIPQEFLNCEKNRIVLRKVPRNKRFLKAPIHSLPLLIIFSEFRFANSVIMKYQMSEACL
jgi:hypothetical protein